MGFQYPSKGFKFPYPSKGSLILQREKKRNFDLFDLPFSFEGIPYPSKEENLLCNFAEPDQSGIFFPMLYSSF
jgi:hypothetical protein